MGFSAVGIGTAVINFIGGAGAMAGMSTAIGATFSSVIAGAIGGAIVGAAIGGLTSMVMDGNIGKGILFGAIGGAVAGGFSGYFEAASLGTQTMADPTTLGFESGPGAGQGMARPEIVQESTRSIGGSLAEAGAGIVKEYGGDMVSGIATAYMSGKSMDKKIEGELALADKKIQGELAILEKQAELVAKGGSGGSGGGGSPQKVPYMDMEKIRQQTAREQMAEDRRQFDVGHDERMLARADIQESKAKRQALFKDYQGKRGVQTTESQTTPSILEMRQGTEALANTRGVGQTESPTEPVIEEALG